MTIHIDPSADPGKDPRRIRFEKMQHEGGGTYEELMALIQEFVALGHNPKDPTDGMYVILGITPEFLETMLFTLRTQPDATIDEFSIIPEAKIEPAPEAVPAADEEFQAAANDTAIPPPAPVVEEAPAPQIKEA